MVRERGEGITRHTGLPRVARENAQREPRKLGRLERRRGRAPYYGARTVAWRARGERQCLGRDEGVERHAESQRMQRIGIPW